MGYGQVIQYKQIQLEIKMPTILRAGCEAADPLIANTPPRKW